MAFHAAMRSAYQGFVALLEEQCRVLVRHHLEAATSEFAMSLFGEDDLSLGQLSLRDDELENAAPARAAVADGAPGPWAHTEDFRA